MTTIVFTQNPKDAIELLPDEYKELGNASILRWTPQYIINGNEYILTSKYCESLSTSDVTQVILLVTDSSDINNIINVYHEALKFDMEVIIINVNEVSNTLLKLCDTYVFDQSYKIGNKVEVYDKNINKIDIAIIGPAGSGKTTLLNSFTGERVNCVDGALFTYIIGNTKYVFNIMMYHKTDDIKADYYIHMVDKIKATHYSRRTQDSNIIQYLNIEDSDSYYIGDGFVIGNAARNNDKLLLHII